MRASGFSGPGPGVRFLVSVLCVQDRGFIDTAMLGIVAVRNVVADIRVGAESVHD